MLADQQGRIAERAAALRAGHPPGTRAGLVFPSSPALILEWLAALHAGLEPCILEYPTPKRSMAYWRESIEDAIARCGLDIVLADPVISQSLAEHPLIGTQRPAGTTPGRADLGGSCRTQGEPSAAGTEAIIQLSSGTTGVKKGLRFTLGQVASHVSAYNQVLALTPDDCIVSWLPLYHDMGFVACFVMPLLLGVPLVLIDPMTWVRTPDILFSAIAAHGGTVCFMPNFAFEVMARVGARPGLDRMRLWISCSEPTFADTLQRFSERCAIDIRTLSVCYGMAENVFAVSQSRGLSVREVDGTALVSCGPPIPGTEVRAVDGQLRVRSATSVRAYVGTGDVADGEGFYATGDRGAVIDGEVFVAGRVRDVMICAGQKYLLTDLDHTLNSVLPDTVGRGAVVAAQRSDLPGTETPIALVERQRFWRQDGAAAEAERLRAATGLQALTVEHVPPHFITKTSSGKINRARTLADWLQCVRRRSRGVIRHANRDADDIVDEIRRLFPDLQADVPFADQLDSLGHVVLCMTIEQYGLDAADAGTLAALAARARTPAAVRVGGEALAHPPQGRVLRVAFLSDGDWMSFVDDALMAALERAAGVPVHVEHVCAPPSFVLLRDLVFHDCFMARDERRDYSGFARAIESIATAGLIVVDDMSELWFPDRNDAVYPVLSHQFHQDSRADLLALRWCRYSSGHHQLARELVRGGDVAPGARVSALRDLVEYLEVPAFRLALTRRYAEWTADWEFHDYHDDAELDSYRWRRSPAEALTAFVAARRGTLRLSEGTPANRIVRNDWPHFCSWLINPEAVDFVVSRYDRFCILGPASSVPYLEAQLAARGKTFRYSSTLRIGDDDVDCVLQTGSWGMPTTSKPVFDLMAAAVDRDRPVNVPDDVARACPPFRSAR